MSRMELIAPCHFGLERVLKQEIYDLGYDVTDTQDGRVVFAGDEEAVCRANIGLRTPERILIRAAEFQAESFDELFEQIRAIPWEQYIPMDGKFWIKKASSIRSNLHSIPDIQSVAKKAMACRLEEAYGQKWLEESGAEYPVRLFLNKNRVTVGLDTSGESLHRRGYRLLRSRAPIEETLAAALIGLTPWKQGRILADPFCGSGTFVIEAAMIAAGIAPGMHRSFTACSWDNLIDRQMWNDCYEEAREAVQLDSYADLSGSDIDPNIIHAAQQNAERAGVSSMVRFSVGDVKDFHHDGQYGFLITNPPYGERLERKNDLTDLYLNIGQMFQRLPTWSKYVITAFNRAEKCIGVKSARKRKVYNGMIQTNFYQFPGPKPKKSEAIQIDR